MNTVMTSLEHVHRLPPHPQRQGEGGRRLTGERHRGDASLPLISVITVALNDAAGLERTMASVRAQRYAGVEHIVIDGGSRDGTLDLLQSCGDGVDYWVSEPDKGIYDAMNKGLSLARGDVIGILNAGDVYAPDGLDIIGRYARTHPDAQFFFGAVVKGILRSHYRPWKIHWSFDFYTCHSVGFFIRRQAQYLAGPYNTAYRCSADYDLFYRMLVKHRMKGIGTHPSELIGTFAPGGYSSRLSYLDHLFEETRIRLDNGQNRLMVLTILVLRFLRNLRRI